MGGTPLHHLHVRQLGHLGQHQHRLGMEPLVPPVLGLVLRPELGMERPLGRLLRLGLEQLLRLGRPLRLGMGPLVLVLPRLLGLGRTPPLGRRPLGWRLGRKQQLRQPFLLEPPRKHDGKHPGQRLRIGLGKPLQQRDNLRFLVFLFRKFLPPGIERGELPAGAERGIVRFDEFLVLLFRQHLPPRVVDRIGLLFERGFAHRSERQRRDLPPGKFERYEYLLGQLPKRFERHAEQRFDLQQRKHVQQ